MPLPRTTWSATPARQPDWSTALRPALTYNGGPTPAWALPLGSPAIDAGANDGTSDVTGAPLTTGQRGFDRYFDGNGDGNDQVDIGAVEWLPAIQVSGSATYV